MWESSNSARTKDISLFMNQSEGVVELTSGPLTSMLKNCVQPLAYDLNRHFFKKVMWVSKRLEKMLSITSCQGNTSKYQMGNNATPFRRGSIEMKVEWQVSVKLYINRTNACIPLVGMWINYSNNYGKQYVTP